MKISYVYGVCAKYDAISNSIQQEIRALRAHGIEDVRLYTVDCRHETLPFVRVNSGADIALDQHFQSSDLVVFHFGIYHDLFNLLPVAPKKAKRLVVFHNITPKEFVAPENHALNDRSFAQMSNILWADQVICDSQLNLEVLRSFGIGVPASVIPLAVHTEAPPPLLKPSFHDGITRIAFIGRFVRSKGPQDLLIALQRALEGGLRLPLRLDMVGNIAFSSQQLIKQMQQTSQDLERRCEEHLQIKIHGDASEEIKHALLREADLFVLPTYHEGFCVPIIEALASACKVIAYHNSNTPAISGGLATLTLTGDIDQLALAIQQSIETVRSSAWQSECGSSYTEYSNIARNYTQQFAPSSVGDRFVHLVRELIGGPHAVSRHAIFQNTALEQVPLAKARSVGE
jgi:glycosyltransferase involved in cell wall biosynthesis